MKKIIILSLITVILIRYASAQECISNAWIELQNKQIPKAKKTIDECYALQPEVAEIVLMRGNVYLQLYQSEVNKLSKNPSYVTKFPDALIIANESFYKALELNPNVKPKNGMFDPKTGQNLCADPIYDMAMNEWQSHNLDRAIYLLKMAIDDYTIGTIDPALKFNLGIFYSQLASLYQELNQPENVKQTLVRGTKTETSSPDIYLQLYDVYKFEKDTIQAGKILRTAIKNVTVDTLKKDIYSTYLDYYSITNDIGKLSATIDTMLKKYGNNSQVIISISIALINNKLYTRAEELLKKGLDAFPDDFGLNSQMAYRYYYEGLDYQDEEEKLLNAKKYNDMASAANKKKEFFSSAHDWSDKAYQLYKDDRTNNIMLQRLKLQLAKDVPDELKEKVDSYRKN